MNIFRLFKPLKYQKPCYYSWNSYWDGCTVQVGAWNLCDVCHADGQWGFNAWDDRTYKISNVFYKYKGIIYYRDCDKKILIPILLLPQWWIWVFKNRDKFVGKDTRGYLIEEHIKIKYSDIYNGEIEREDYYWVTNKQLREKLWYSRDTECNYRHELEILEILQEV